MRILVTNDDGFSAPGLQAVVRHLRDIADVVVVAPDRDRSGTASGLSLRRRITLNERNEYGVPGYSCSGTPVDCVRLACLGFNGTVPDLVVSGINSAENLGRSVEYSGTVAAAMEAVKMGVPGIAASICRSRPIKNLKDDDDVDQQYERLAELVRLVSGTLDSGCSEKPYLLNINGPNTHPYNDVQLTNLAQRQITDSVQIICHSDGRHLLDIYNSEPTYLSRPGTDVYAVEEGSVSITPLYVGAVASAVPPWAKWLCSSLRNS